MSYRSLTFVWAVLLALSFGQVAIAGEDLRAGDVVRSGLTRTQAQQVLTVALREAGFDLAKPGISIDGELVDQHGEPPHPGYFDFSVGYDAPDAGATEYLGLFAVSRLTGDVWEINRCRRFASPELRRLQASIAKRTRKSFRDEHAARKGLGCTE